MSFVKGRFHDIFLVENFASAIFARRNISARVHSTTKSVFCISISCFDFEKCRNSDVSGFFVKMLEFDWFRFFISPVKGRLKAVKVGHKFLLPVGNKWNSFVKFRRLPGGHTCHIKRATCNILIFLRNIVILKQSGGEKVNIFLK